MKKEIYTKIKIFESFDEYQMRINKIDESYINDAIDKFKEMGTELSNAIKNMSINRKTLQILAKLKTLVRQHGKLIESQIYNILTPDELNLLDLK